MKAVRLVLMLCALLPVASSIGQLPDALESQAREALPQEALADAGFHVLEGHGSGEYVPPGDGTPGLFRVHVSKPTPNQWEAGMRWNCGAAVRDGDVLLLLFEARSLPEGGQGEIRAVFRRREKPYLHCLSETVEPVQQWRQFALAFSPEFTEEAGDAYLILNFGGRSQTTEIRHLRLLQFGTRTPMGQLVRHLGSDVVRSSRRAVGRPLTPATLWDMGVIDGFDSRGYRRDGAGRWTADYSIWTCHGYLFHANRTVGMLRLARAPRDDGRVDLRVSHKLVNDEAVVQEVSVEAICAEDMLSTAESWVLFTRCIGPDEAVVPTSEMRVLGTVANGQWRVELGGLAHTRTTVDVVSSVSTDWSLFDAVMRRPRLPTSGVRFDLLEGFSARKTDMILRDRGTQVIALGDSTAELRCYTMIGHGVLPYTFWVDSDGRLVLVITHSRVYILDGEAEAKMNHAIQIQQQRYARVRPRIDARRGDN